VLVSFPSCRATEWPFWLGFIVPFLILYIFDWIMFAIIITSILKKRRAANKLESQSNFKLYRENLIIALSLAVVFGLGWGFGLLATSYPVEELTITFQVLFSIFVGAQGALLFLLHGVRNSDARGVWKRLAISTNRQQASFVHKSVSGAQKSTSTLQNFSMPLSEHGNSDCPPTEVLKKT
jgi:hypothetical protein